jgi:hypothetical protein
MMPDEYEEASFKGLRDPTIPLGLRDRYNLAVANATPGTSP